MSFELSLAAASSWWWAAYSCPFQHPPIFWILKLALLDAFVGYLLFVDFLKCFLSIHFIEIRLSKVKILLEMKRYLGRGGNLNLIINSLVK